jgi:hypothetical protein
MADSTGKTRRVVVARRAIALGTVAATALAAASQAGPVGGGASDSPDSIILAAGEGEGEAGAASGGEGEGEAGAASGGEGEGEGGAASGGEGEGEGEGAASGGEGEGEGEGEGAGAGLAPEVAFISDLGFMTGHLRAGMALYEQGVLDEAKTHMGHPIEEKYDAVAGELEARGFGGLREQILALSGAAESEADPAEVRALFETVIATVGDVRAASPGGARDQLLALAALTRTAAAEYDVAIADDGSVGNLHEYQDSWGFLRTVEAEAERLATSGDAAVAEAGTRILEQVRVTDAAFGDLAGANIPSADPSILFGAAARMDLAAMAVN